MKPPFPPGKQVCEKAEEVLVSWGMSCSTLHSPHPSSSDVRHDFLMLGFRYPRFLSQSYYQTHSVQAHKLLVLSYVLFHIRMYHVSETLKT